MGRMFDQLNTKTIKTLAPGDVDLIKDNTHIQELNKKELETINLISQARGINDGRPQNNTQFVEVGDAVTDNAKEIFFTSGSQETWQLSGLHFAVTGQSGSLTYRFGIIDPNDLTKFVYTASAAVAAGTLVFDNENATMPNVSNGLALFSEVTGSYTNYKAHHSLVRIR